MCDLGLLCVCVCVGSFVCLSSYARVVLWESLKWEREFAPPLTTRILSLLPSLQYRNPAVSHTCTHTHRQSMPATPPKETKSAPSPPFPLPPPPPSSSSSSCKHRHLCTHTARYTRSQMQCPPFPSSPLNRTLHKPPSITHSHPHPHPHVPT